MKKMEIKYITKCAPLLPEKKDLVKAKLPVAETKNFWELRGISLAINQGEGIGLLGTNGSGKSALINILAGHEKQTTGFITMEAKVNLASIHSISDVNLTGLENIKQAVFAAKLDEFKANHLINAIINFSELGEWLYRPVKTYSLGVTARLALSLALYVEPQLVLIDSLLGAINLSFFKKVAQRIDNLKDRGVSFVIADTNVINIERFCERTLWLQFGQAQDFGATRDVMVQFEYFSSWYQALALPEKNEYLAQKEHERQTFDVGTVYEEFKVEQFKHGFTRKDEPRMRKAFYKDRGADPVNLAVTEETKKAAPTAHKTKKKQRRKLKTFIVSGVLVLVLIFLWAALSHKAAVARTWESVQSTFGKKQAQTSSSSKKNSLAQSQKNASAAAKTSAAQASSKAQASSAKAASESSAKAQSASASSAKAASESQQALLKNTQTINVQSGDTLEALAEKYATTVDKLKAINKLSSDSDLKAGDVIHVPQ
ncbi:ATP-binding cassette domain-containing protein [Liquorilactobacillus satsumensis]|uniref:ATP-binding cassette domain-containing protein n=1 Tax=Liquorilactobacillus satsumensis TaxID=259059 RepID=UPI001E5F4350|nr:ATP-binding cassette domain-containing protein [Liquorilactobacillus satsumensis]MCC7666502.1 teichoic acid ABC transporter ATP-binding protein [Liquorilactobacillus satsumensis]MCP9357532.1 ATP-binding cassette domain-containing protein [Liquorilactobacillus satsumensis]MCP9371360.1 ATP-binding cassette domain-containing protein [Liquorilactobacillus satsumensis]